MDESPKETSISGNLSRQERRQLRRQAQKADGQNFRRNRTLRRILIWGLSILVIIGLGYGMIKLAGSVPVSSSGGMLSKPIDAADNISGVVSASITLVEYSDFQCPACAAFAPIVDKVLKEPDLLGKVRLVYRYFPLQMHPNAQIAAQAAQAAAEQGKFWPMHDSLFEKQADWENLSNTGAREVFINYASQLSLDVERFKTEIDSQNVKDKIQSDYDSGIASGVDATPTFFVNGVKMPQPQSYDEFKNFITDGIPSNIP